MFCFDEIVFLRIYGLKQQIGQSKKTWFLAETYSQWINFEFHSYCLLPLKSWTSTFMQNKFLACIYCKKYENIQSSGITFIFSTPISPSFTPVDLLELQDRSRSFSLSFILSSSISFHPSPSLHHSLSIILSLSISISLYLCLSLSISLFLPLSLSLSLSPLSKQEKIRFIQRTNSRQNCFKHPHINTQTLSELQLLTNNERKRHKWVLVLVRILKRKREWVVAMRTQCIVVCTCEKSLNSDSYLEKRLSA